MANLAQEEADRYFTQPRVSSSHPEDHADRDSHSSDDEDQSNQTASEPTLQRGTLDDENDTDDDDVSHQMSTLSTSRATYRIPTTISYANTGPKGVIADAQSFARARQSAAAQRRTLTTNGLISSSSSHQNHPNPNSRTSSPALSDSDSDSESLMATWRATRLAELQSQPQATSRIRTYGHAHPVDATTYLSILDTCPTSTTVVVLLYDPASPHSHPVEDEIDILAAKHPRTRFIKLDKEAVEGELEFLVIPAVIAYRGGDVVASIGSANASGMEAEMTRLGVLVD